MKKILLLTAFAVCSQFAFSQTLIDKSKEEQIRKNLIEYKALIKEHKNTVKENNELKAKIDLLNKQIIECNKPKEKKQSKLKTFWLKVKKLFSKKA